MITPAEALIRSQLVRLEVAEFRVLMVRPLETFADHLGVTKQSVLAAIRATRQELEQALRVIGHD